MVMVDVFAMRLLRLCLCTGHAAAKRDGFLPEHANGELIGIGEEVSDGNNVAALSGCFNDESDCVALITFEAEICASGCGQQTSQSGNRWLQSPRPIRVVLTGRMQPAISAWSLKLMGMSPDYCAFLRR